MRTLVWSTTFVRAFRRAVRRQPEIYRRNFGQGQHEDGRDVRRERLWEPKKRKKQRLDPKGFIWSLA